MRIKSLAVTPAPSAPVTVTRMRFGRRWRTHWVANTWVTSLEPMPGERAEGAMGAGVAIAADQQAARQGEPSSGPITWTMPWRAWPVGKCAMPDSPTRRAAGPPDGGCSRLNSHPGRRRSTRYGRALQGKRRAMHRWPFSRTSLSARAPLKSCSKWRSTCASRPLADIADDVLIPNLVKQCARLRHHRSPS